MYLSNTGTRSTEQKKLATSKLYSSSSSSTFNGGFYIDIIILDDCLTLCGQHRGEFDDCMSRGVVSKENVKNASAALNKPSEHQHRLRVFELSKRLLIVGNNGCKRAKTPHGV